MTTQTLTTENPKATTLEQWVFRIAGAFVLVSLALSQLHATQWLWFTAFVGANLVQASFTGLCPLASLLSKLGVRPGAAFRAAGARSVH